MYVDAGDGKYLLFSDLFVCFVVQNLQATVGERSKNACGMIHTHSPRHTNLWEDVDIHILKLFFLA